MNECISEAMVLMINGQGTMERSFTSLRQKKLFHFDTAPPPLLAPSKRHRISPSSIISPDPLPHMSTVYLVNERSLNTDDGHLAPIQNTHN